jgi:hypothetical protein
MTPIEWILLFGGGGFLLYSVGNKSGAVTQQQSANISGEISNIARYVTQAGGVSPASNTILLDNLSQLEAMLQAVGSSTVQPILSSGGFGGVVINVPVNQGGPTGVSSIGGGQGSSGLGNLGGSGLGNLGGSGGSGGSGDGSGALSGSGGAIDTGANSSDFTE